METQNYITELSVRLMQLVDEGLEYNYKMLEAVTREDWDKADLYQLTAEDIDQEIGVLLLIQSAFSGEEN
jgi:hypothetical protein